MVSRHAFAEQLLEAVSCRLPRRDCRGERNENMPEIEITRADRMNAEGAAQLCAKEIQSLSEPGLEVFLVALQRLCGKEMKAAFERLKGRKP